MICLWLIILPPSTGAALSSKHSLSQAMRQGRAGWSWVQQAGVGGLCSVRCGPRHGRRVVQCPVWASSSPATKGGIAPPRVAVSAIQLLWALTCAKWQGHGIGHCRAWNRALQGMEQGTAGHGTAMGHGIVLLSWHTVRGLHGRGAKQAPERANVWMQHATAAASKAYGRCIGWQEGPGVGLEAWTTLVAGVPADSSRITNMPPQIPRCSRPCRAQWHG